MVLYLIIFLAPAFMSDIIMDNLDAYYVKDRASEFLADAGDGISLTDYILLNNIAAKNGYALKVNVTTLDHFYTDEELREAIEDEELEIVPGTLIEIYMEKERIFLYDSKIYSVSSDEL
jgi:hypothetical protein